MQGQIGYELGAEFAVTRLLSNNKELTEANISSRVRATLATVLMGFNILIRCRKLKIFSTYTSVSTTQGFCNACRDYACAMGRQFRAHK
jgi:hypothetical protein